MALGISAAVTIFIAWPIAPNHPEPTRSVGSQIALWLAFWLLLATAIRLLMLMIGAIRSRHLRRNPGVQ
jgi:hypothetical protein